MSFSTWIRLAAHRVVSDCDFRTSSPTHQKVFELCRVTYACGFLCMCVEFRDEIHLRGKECETLKNPNFLLKGKTVISVEKSEIL